MGTLKVAMTLDVSGPLADGRAIDAAEKWQENTSRALGEEGVRLLRAVPMDKSGRSHGAFRDALKVVRQSPSEVRVPGPQVRGVVWSSWLEGTSRRNESTKFRGYHLFRAARLALEKQAPEIGQAELDKLMAEIGGE